MADDEDEGVLVDEFAMEGCFAGFGRRRAQYPTTDSIVKTNLQNLANRFGLKTQDNKTMHGYYNAEGWGAWGDIVRAAGSDGSAGVIDVWPSYLHVSLLFVTLKQPMSVAALRTALAERVDFRQFFGGKALNGEVLRFDAQTTGAWSRIEAAPGTDDAINRMRQRLEQALAPLQGIVKSLRAPWGKSHVTLSGKYTYDTNNNAPSTRRLSPPLELSPVRWTLTPHHPLQADGTHSAIEFPPGYLVEFPVAIPRPPQDWGMEARAHGGGKAELAGLKKRLKALQKDPDSSFEEQYALQAEIARMRRTCDVDTIESM